MTLNLLAIIMVAGFMILFVMMFFLNLRISNVFFHLDAKIDRFVQEYRASYDNLLLRIDTTNARLDTTNARLDELYRHLFNKKAA